jgi:hypothetical protein
LCKPGALHPAIVTNGVPKLPGESASLQSKKFTTNCNSDSYIKSDSLALLELKKNRTVETIQPKDQL